MVFGENGERGGRRLASHLLLWEPIDVWSYELSKHGNTVFSNMM